MAVACIVPLMADSAQTQPFLCSLTRTVATCGNNLELLPIGTASGRGGFPNGDGQLARHVLQWYVDEPVKVKGLDVGP